MKLTKKNRLFNLLAFNTPPSEGEPGSGGNGGQGGGGSVAPSWRDSLSDDIKAHPSLANYNDVSGLAKDYINQQKLIGADKIAIPGQDDKDGWNTVFNKLGRPETSDGYEIKKFDGYPENLQFDENFVKPYSDKMHELGLTKAQADGLFKFHTQQQSDALKSYDTVQAQVQAAAEATLKQDWGSAYDQNLALAKRAVGQFGDEELINYLNETGAGNDPKFIRLFHKIAEATLEDTSEGGGDGGKFIMTPAEAKAKIVEKQQDEGFMKIYNDKGHHGHNEAVKAMSDLFKLAYPE